jgi:hypothetical protein
VASVLFNEVLAQFLQLPVPVQLSLPGAGLGLAALRLTRESQFRI